MSEIYNSLCGQNYTMSELRSIYEQECRMGRGFVVLTRSPWLDNICRKFHFRSFEFDGL